MNFMSQKCATQLANSLPLFQIVVGWIAGREHKKLINTGSGAAQQLAAFDTACQQIFSQLAANPAANVTDQWNYAIGGSLDFANAIMNFYNTSPVCPGWNDATCSMNWGEFACFCAAAAPMNPTDIIALGQNQPAGTPVAYTCTGGQKTDPIYAVQPGGTTPFGGGGTQPKSWTPWILGGLGVVAVGVTGVVLLRHHPKKKV